MKTIIIIFFTFAAFTSSTFASETEVDGMIKKLILASVGKTTRVSDTLTMSVQTGPDADNSATQKSVFEDGIEKHIPFLLDAQKRILFSFKYNPNESISEGMQELGAVERTSGVMNHFRGMVERALIGRERKAQYLSAQEQLESRKLLCDSIKELDKSLVEEAVVKRINSEYVLACIKERKIATENAAHLKSALLHPFNQIIVKYAAKPLYSTIRKNRFLLKKMGDPNSLTMQALENSPQFGPHLTQGTFTLFLTYEEGDKSDTRFQEYYSQHWNKFDASYSVDDFFKMCDNALFYLFSRKFAVYKAVLAHEKALPELYT